MDNWKTTRPIKSLIGAVYNETENLASRLCSVLVERLDQGDGWTWQDTERMYSWLFGRLQASIRWQTPAEGDCDVARCDITIVDGVRSLNSETISLLNSLNAHAAGWFYWHDDVTGAIISSSQIRVVQAEWWWAIIMWNSLPLQVTCADAAADRLASSSGGAVAVRTHPGRGRRQGVDGWLVGVRLGARDMSASLDQFTSELDLKAMVSCLDDLFDVAVGEVNAPLSASVRDDSGAIRLDFRRVWNPDGGWAWQWSSVDGVPPGVDRSDEQGLARLAVERNRATGVGLGLRSTTELGGWFCFIGLGLVHVSKIDGLTAEELLTGSERTAGVAMAIIWHGLMRELDRSYAQVASEVAESALSHLGSVGPLGWSYLLYDDEQPLYSDTTPSESSIWSLPRHSLVCCWGTFNAAGPSIGSLEVTYTNYGALLWWVHRHPRRPRLELLADLEGDRHTGEFWQEFGVAVQRALSETDADRRVLGSWPHFLQVFDSTLLEAVIGGVCAYAAAVRSDAELRSAAATLIRHAGDPWEMLDAERAQPDASEGNAVEEWCFALTNEDVIAGMQLFMRSAWEVAKQLVQDDGSADATVLSNVRHGFNEIVYSARERALGDYTFRKETRPLVQSAVGAERRRQRAPRPNHGSGRPAGVMVRPKGAANERPDPTPRP